MKKTNDTYTSSSSHTNEIPATVHAQLNVKPKSQPTKMLILANSGATIPHGGPQHSKQMEITKKHLQPCSKRISTVGGSFLPCQRWLPVTFNIEGHSNIYTPSIYLQQS